jgi:hypothetical protein
MKKIASLFQRNYDGDRQVRNEVVPGSEWVIHGEGYATRKWDGMAIKLENAQFFKRYDAKAGRTPPPEFIPAQPAPDPQTGHWPGWVPLQGKELNRVVAAYQDSGITEDGTFEFCGPTIGTRHGANPERLTKHILVPHGQDILADCPRDFDGLKAYLANADIEGVVWWHPDGRKVKIKAADFGLVRHAVI